MTFEEMKKDIFKSAKKIINFIGLECTDEQIKDAVEYSRFENMQKIEKGEGINYLKHYKGNFGQELGKTNIEKDHKEGGIMSHPRVRKGKVGGYLQDLGKQEVEFIHKLYTNMIEKNNDL